MGIELADEQVRLQSLRTAPEINPGSRAASVSPQKFLLRSLRMVSKPGRRQREVWKAQ